MVNEEDVNEAKDVILADDINTAEAIQQIEGQLNVDDMNDQAERDDKVFVPDMRNLKELQPSAQAYSVMEKFQLDWPMMSMDYICTNQLYTLQPFQMCFVGGSYTDGSEKPSIQLVRISNLGLDQNGSSDSEAEASIPEFYEPTIERRLFDVQSNVLKVKSATSYLNNQYQCGMPSLCAAWLEDGTFAFYNIDRLF